MKSKLNNMKGGTRYECNPNNKFKDICKEKENGKYKSKDGCINDCEIQYIRNEIKKINIDGEATKFYLFIKDIIKNEKFDVIFALLVFQHIHEKDINLYLKDIAKMTKKLIVFGRRYNDEFLTDNNKKTIFKTTNNENNDYKIIFRRIYIHLR